METTIAIKGLSHSYKLYHITDLHLTKIGENEPDFRHQEAALRASCIFEIDGTPVGQRLEDYYADARKWGADLMLMTGDMTDTPSDPNVQTLYEAIGTGGVKTFFVIGNHDWSYSDDYHTENARVQHYHKFAPLSDGAVARHYLEYSDLIIAGIDNGLECVQDEDIDFLKTLAGKGKPIVLCMHIPINCPTLEAETVKNWHRNINIGQGAIVKNEATPRFCEYVRDPASGIAAVIVGHLHFSHEDELAPGLVQYITGGAYLGISRKITLVPGEE
ncbi:MAG: metallophosphoesterase [Clostridia bacterium]|nr:metallophosphoesterase [Clostridia bacterium]